VVNASLSRSRPSHPSWALLLLVAATPLVVLPAGAQTSDRARIQALEAELEAIRTSAEAGQDVAARIDALEKSLVELKAEMASDQAAGAPGAAGPASAFVPEAGMQGAPNPLQDDKRYLTGEDLLDADFPNSLPIPGTDNRFAIGGYVKLDAIQDLGYIGDPNEFSLATIPVQGIPEATLDGRTTLHAKETRVNFDFRRRAHNEKRGIDFPLQVFVEFDLFDDQSFLRLRHAYGVLGRLLAGQTWNVTSDVDALPGLIDFSDGDAAYYDRVSQVRWQARLNDRTTWAVGVEEPETAIANPLGLAGEDRPDRPSIAGNLRWTAINGSHFQLGVDLFELNWQGGATGPSDTQLGYALNLTGRYLLGGNDRNAILAGGSIGEGASHRVSAFEADNNDAVITSAGLDVISHRQLQVGYSHYWQANLNSTFSVNWASLDNSAFQPGSAIHQARSIHANIIWFPYRAVSTGFEIMWGERDNMNGASGDAIRVQYMFKYKFN